MLAKFTILKNWPTEILNIRKQNYCNLVGKNQADIESGSKHKQMTMSTAQFQLMKSTEAVRIRLPHGIWFNKGASILFSQYRPNSWS